MARAEYIVAFLDGAWTVSLNGQPHGPYSSQESAARAAIEAAHKAEALGHAASVEVQDGPAATKDDPVFEAEPFETEALLEEPAPRLASEAA